MGLGKDNQEILISRILKRKKSLKLGVRGGIN